MEFEEETDEVWEASELVERGDIFLESKHGPWSEI